jgi:hypothetical protein
MNHKMEAACEWKMRSIFDQNLDIDMPDIIPVLQFVLASGVPPTL